MVAINEFKKAGFLAAFDIVILAETLSS